MNKTHGIGAKLMLLLLLISLMLTSCSLLPTTVSETVKEDASDMVTISRAEFDRLKQYEELSEIQQVVDQYFYLEPDHTAMLDGAALGLLYGLNDPYSRYLNPEDYAQMWADDEGNYAGIGIQIMADYTTGLCTITRVFLNSPALEAGLRKGDILTKADDLDVIATTLQDAVTIMRGEVGKTVNVQVQRGTELLDFVIARANVHVNYVNSCMLENDIGYISLYEFAGDCSTAFKTQLDALVDEGAKALIMDLRDNPGGWVDDAAKLADIFLPAGDLTSLVYRDGTTENYTTSDGALDLPLVVLVNGNSASASEILSGALQDYKRATIVGTQTYGKGVVQYVLPIGSRGAGMQLTVAQYYTPNGHAVHKIGITPDILCELPPDDTTMYEIGDMADAQLAKAYEIMMDMLAK
ncbi:MAG: S41 family peptidase [Clostridia bacterium]